MFPDGGAVKSAERAHGEPDRLINTGEKGTATCLCNSAFFYFYFFYCIA